MTSGPLARFCIQPTVGLNTLYGLPCCDEKRAYSLPHRLTSTAPDMFPVAEIGHEANYELAGNRGLVIYTELLHSNVKVGTTTCKKAWYITQS